MIESPSRRKKDFRRSKERGGQNVRGAKKKKNSTGAKWGGGDHKHGARKKKKVQKNPCN